MRGLLTYLPMLNACLNGASALLLLVGYQFIRRRRIAEHKQCMLSALAVSMLFLVSYLILRFSAGMTRFTEPGWIRPVYFTILVSHIGLAALIVPLALLTIYRALSARLEQHVRIARWTLPLWLYVSVTGVLIYWILYHLYPQG